MDNPTKPILLICEPMKPIRQRMAEVARAAGLEVVETDAGKSAFQLAGQVIPRLVILSTEIRDVHADDMLKIFKLSAGTQAIPVVIATDEKNLRKLRTYTAIGAAECIPRIIDRELLALLLHKHAHLDVDAARPKTRVTQAIRREPGKPDAPAPAVEEKSSLLRKAAQCPLHDPPVTFHYWDLRARTQIIEPNAFDVPCYKGGVKQFESVAFLLHEAKVCPECLYASTDIRYFVGADDKRSARDIWPPRLRQELKNAEPERRKLLTCVVDALIQPERSVEAGLQALQLAISTSMTIYTFDAKTYPLELYRVANYHLRMAQILKEAGRGEPEERALRTAYECLQKAYPAVLGAEFYRLTYQLLSLGIYFGELERVGPYFSKLQQEMRESSAGVVTDELAKDYRKLYHAKCQKAWEDREYLKKGASS